MMRSNLDKTSLFPAWKLCLVASLFMSPRALALDPNPVLDGQTFNVLTFQGDKGLTYRVGNGAWTLGVSPIGSQLGITFGSPILTAMLGGVPLTNLVIANHGLGSNPAPSLVNGTPQIQPFSMVGLDLPNLGDPSSNLPLSLELLPPAGSYTGPQMLSIKVVGGTGLPVSSEVTFGDGRKVTFDGPNGQLPLPPGNWTLSFTANQGNGTATVSGTWNIANSTDPTLDTDFDGIPDIVESGIGLDLFKPDFELDSDGDGWSNLDEWLRGCPSGLVPTSGFTAPADCTCQAGNNGMTNCRPKDTDSDGWADWDEDLRSTLPENPLSFPAARTLYQREVLVDWSANIDNTSDTFDTRSGSVSATELTGAPLVMRKEDGLALAGAFGRSPASAADRVPLRGSYKVRLPGETTWLLRTQVFGAENGVPKPTPLVYKGIRQGLLPFSLAFLASRAGEGRGGPTWTTAEGWRESLAEAMAKQLVTPDDSSAMSPRTTARAAIVESLVAWHEGPDTASWVVLGEPGAASGHGAAVQAFGTQFAAHVGESEWQEGLRLLLFDLDAWEDQAVYAAFDTKVQELFASANSSAPEAWSAANASTLDVELARWLQTDKAALSARIASRVLAYFSLDRLFEKGFSWGGSPKLSDLTDPAADYDGDGANHEMELAGPASRVTNILEVDTDGDGLDDSEDVCGNDPQNACWPAISSYVDFDKDGIADVIDNCPSVRNGLADGKAEVAADGSGDVVKTAPAAQLDTDHDGIGDACDGLAYISSPRSNLNVLVGDSISLVAEAAGTTSLGQMQISWEIVLPKLSSGDAAVPASNDGGAAAGGGDIKGIKLPLVDGATSPGQTYSGPNPTSFLVTAPGRYEIRMTATTPTTEKPFTDIRYLEAFGLPLEPPTLACNIPPSALEGTTVDFSATATTDLPGTLSYEWSINKKVKTGPEVSELFDQQGTYEVVCSVVHSSGLKTSETHTITIDDSVPVPSSTYAPTGIDLEVAFTDTSAAWDGVSKVTWEILGNDTANAASPAAGYAENIDSVDTGESSLQTTLTFPYPGLWTVRHSVSDNDNNLAFEDIDIVVAGSGLQLLNSQVGSAWTNVPFYREMNEPVVLIGVPQVIGDSTTRQVVIRNVTKTGFQARLATWGASSNISPANAVVSFLAIERGRHELADGSVWLAGTFLTGNVSGQWAQRLFAQPLPEKPTVILNAQTSTSTLPSMLRLRDPRRAGFEVARDSLVSSPTPPLVNEKGGYLAVSGNMSEIALTAGQEARSVQDFYGYDQPVIKEKSPNSFFGLVTATKIRLRHDPRYRLGQWLELAGLPSSTHGWETANMLVVGAGGRIREGVKGIAATGGSSLLGFASKEKMGGAIFGATTSDRELDPFVILSRPPVTTNNAATIAPTVNIEAPTY